MKNRELTHKERMLISGVISGKSQTQAAILAGYSKRSAAVIACKTLRKVNVRVAVTAGLSEHNTSLVDILEPLSDGLVAVKTNRSGKVVIDHNVRLETVNMILKLMGVFK